MYEAMEEGLAPPTKPLRGMGLGMRLLYGWEGCEANLVGGARYEATVSGGGRVRLRGCERWR